MIATIRPGGVSPTFSPSIPGSKSITNRALVAAACAAGTSQIRWPLDSDDTRAMADALSALGAVVGFGSSSVGNPSWEVGGPLTEGRNGPTRVWCNRAGTVARFLPPIAGALGGAFEFEADSQMAARPMEALYEALRTQGASVVLLDAPRTFPVHLDGDGLRGGVVELPDGISSQFLSGLMLACPLARQPLTLRAKTTVSQPYIDMTASVMGSFGVDVEIVDDTVTVDGSYKPRVFEVEPDASTASYFLAAAAITRGTVQVERLGLNDTTQGDARLATIFAEMGCEVSPGPPLTLVGPPRLRGVTVDMADCSDVFMTLACVAPFCGSPTVITGIGHARRKESDRVAATVHNLREIGIGCEEWDDAIEITPGTPRPGCVLPTYDDHRMAMAFSVIGLRSEVTLQDPHVVEKTCPSFFELWRETGAHVEVRSG